MADTSGTEASSDEDELREARQAVREHNRKKKKSGGFQSMGRCCSKHRNAGNDSILSCRVYLVFEFYYNRPFTLSRCTSSGSVINCQSISTNILIVVSNNMISLRTQSCRLQGSDEEGLQSTYTDPTKG